ncbi:MAG TPA: type VI secretion system lipoprotein TssJ [Acetobacteraceae bacterium]|nr:type VI secretion system lipoprotein TssJ [Acetobacteraceae bacterium]
MTKWVHVVSALLLLTGFAGCSAPPPPPTEVDLSLSASADVNPTASGEAAPIVVRVYQLASTSGFEGAEFFQLFNQDQAVLKTDLVKKDEFVLAPGQKKTTTLMPTDQVTALGILAAYRDFQHEKWRATVPVPAHKTTVVTATIGHDGVVAKAEPAKKAGS